MTQSTAIVSNEDFAKNVEEMLNAKPVEVETTEDAFGELNRRYNLDKTVILNTLLGLDYLHTNDAMKARSLSSLFTQYFRGTVDPIFLESDLEDLNKILKNEKEDAGCFVVFPMKHKIKKGMFTNKLSFLVAEGVSPAKQRQVIIGSSRRDCAVYFVFLNDKTDVNNGVIYVRNGALGRLRRVNTYEINPFVKGQGIATDKATGASEVKLQLTFNPTWLTNTVDNMDRYIFAPLVYVPPKMPKPKKQKGITEVNMENLIEKALQNSKIDPAKAGAQVAEEVRNGIDSYATTALEKLAERQSTFVEDLPVINDKIAEKIDVEQPYAYGKEVKTIVFDEPEVAEDGIVIGDAFRKVAERNDGVVDPLRGNEPANFEPSDLHPSAEGQKAAVRANILDNDVNFMYPDNVHLDPIPNETTLKAMEESRAIIDSDTARFKSADELFAELDKPTVVFEDVDSAYPVNPAVFALQPVPNDDPNGLTNQQLLAVCPRTEPKSTLGQKPSMLDTELGAGLYTEQHHAELSKLARNMEQVVVDDFDKKHFPPAADLDSGCMGLASGND